MADLIGPFLQRRKQEAREAEEVVRASKDLTKYDQVVGAMQPHQRQLHESKSRFDAVICARQVGKTWGALLLVFAACLLSKQTWIIVGPTLKALKRNYLPAYETINDRFKLGITFNRSDHYFTFPNGSVVHLHGADTGEAIERLRGATLDGLVIDEAQMYPLADLDKLIDDIAMATLKVRRGRLILVGTPGPTLAGQFYLATCTPAETVGNSGEPSNYDYGSPATGLWCKHTWEARANLAAPHAWEDGLRIKNLKGWADDNPTWLREYLGVWVASDETKVYTFDARKNTYDGLLPAVPPNKPWRLVLGVDLGQSDGTAMVVWAFSDAFPTLYEVYSEKRRHTAGNPLHLRHIANWRDEVYQQFGPFEAEVCDAGGLGKFILDSFADEYGFTWEPAEKHLKEDFIRLFNDDLEYGYIKLRKASQEYQQELLKNAWQKGRDGYVPPVGHRTENPVTPNDLCDAGLYAFRWAYHRLYRPDVLAPEVPAAWRHMQERYHQEREALRQLIEGRQLAAMVEDELEALCARLR